MINKLLSLLNKDKEEEFTKSKVHTKRYRKKYYCHQCIFSEDSLGTEPCDTCIAKGEHILNKG